MTQQPILVIGPNGTMAREALACLGQRSAPLRVLTRREAPAETLPPGVEVFTGDLRDEVLLERAFRGAKSAFYVAPHAADEDVLTQNVIRACEKSGARLVYAGVHLDGPVAAVRSLQRALVALLAPHYSGKFRSSERVRQSQARAVLLVPTNFAQNDELFREEILAGTFPEPLGHRGTNRVDVRDIGLAACRALIDSRFPAGIYPVVGPETLTGPACAEIWSRELGREVRYTGDGDDWMRIIQKRLHGQKRSDFIDTFRLLPRYEMPTNPAHLERTRHLLGREPRRYLDYVRDALARWRSGNLDS